MGELSLRLAQRVAGSFEEIFKQRGDEYVFAPRPHPSDTIDQAKYYRLFACVPTLDTTGIHTEKVVSASDVPIAHRSGTLLQAAVCQWPSITLNQCLAPGFTFPLVDAGASLPSSPEELRWSIPELLDGVSPRCQDLRRGMLPFKPDGQAADRVAAVVWRAIMANKAS